MARTDPPLRREDNEEHLQEVLPHLFIGDIVAAQSSNLLSSRSITRLVDLSNMFPGASDERVVEVTEGTDAPVVSRLEVHVEDAASEDMSWAFDACNAYIEACRQRGEIVLVHCFQGKSRSSTIVIGYLMLCQGKTLREAYEVTKRARPMICPNDGFKWQLMQLEQQRFPERPPSINFKVRTTRGPPARLLATTARPPLAAAALPPPRPAGGCR